MSLLHKLQSITERSAKRIGRGVGSGKGSHTSSRGTKGQRSRVGATIALWFEGGQLPLIKRLPMWRGKSRFKVVRPTAELTLTDISKMKSDTISLETLKLEKMIDHRFKKAKIVNSGTLSRKITVQGISMTAGARKAIEQAGGTVK